jgi:hypothetical protein
MQGFLGIPSELWSDLSALGTLISGIATCFLFVVAIIGINQWREQLKGTNRYNIARQLALLAFQFKDDFDRARFPLTYSQESAGRPRQENETRQEADAKDEYYARAARLQSLHETYQKMRVANWEAELTLGKELAKYMAPLVKEYSDYRTAFDRHFWLRLNDVRRPPEVEFNPDEIREREELRRKVYFSIGDNDPLNEPVKSLVEYLQKSLR